MTYYNTRLVKDAEDILNSAFIVLCLGSMLLFLVTAFIGTTTDKFVALGIFLWLFFWLLSVEVVLSAVDDKINKMRWKKENTEANWKKRINKIL